MFIDQNVKSTLRDSDGRNEIGLVIVRLSSARPNRAGGSSDLRAINMSLLRSGRIPTEAVNESYSHGHPGDRI